MFRNIDAKIQVLAEVMCWIGIAASIITGIALRDTDYGLLIMIGGSIVSYLNSLILYGFGKMIEKMCDIQEDIEEMRDAIRDMARNGESDPKHDVPEAYDEV